MSDDIKLYDPNKTHEERVAEAIEDIKNVAKTINANKIFCIVANNEGQADFMISPQDGMLTMFKHFARQNPSAADLINYGINHAADNKEEQSLLNRAAALGL